MSQLKPRPTDECAVFSSSLSPYLDGELDPDHAVDMEAHVVACADCSERVALLRATRQSLKRSVERRCSDTLRIRAVAAMHEARVQQAAAAPAMDEMVPEPKLIRFRYAVGLAAAAGITFAMGVSRYAPPSVADSPRATATATTATMPSGFDVLEDLVSLHANPLPPETTNPEDVTRLSPLIGVPVRNPAFQPLGASFNGARVHSIVDRRAALLQYTLQGGHRVTVYVFDPRVMSVETMPLQPRVVHRHPVYVGSVRGYSVAAAEQGGVGYALASDLGADKSTDLVLTAAAQQGIIEQ